MTVEPQQVRRRRVAPMAPDRRRVALIEAALPLLRTHGLDVSTRQIAEAAGVAEGTIFRVFPDKAAFIQAALCHAFNPEPTLAAIAAIPAGDGLRSRMTSAATILSQRIIDNVPLMLAMHRTGPTPAPTPRQGGSPALGREAMTQLVDAVTELIEPDAGLLARPPAEVGWLFTSMIMMASRARTMGADLFEAEDMVSVLLDGVRRREPDR